MSEIGIAFPKEPPYTYLDEDRLARALAKGEAWGGWLQSAEAQQVFRIPFLSKMEPPDRLALIEKGAIYLVEFAPGAKLRPNDLPTFQTMRWLDAATTRRILLRVRELEWSEGHHNVPSAQAILVAVEAHERRRPEVVTGLRKKLGLGAG